MLRPYIDGLMCKLANYIFINFKISYLTAQSSDFDDLFINIIMGAHFLYVKQCIYIICQ